MQPPQSDVPPPSQVTAPEFLVLEDAIYPVREVVAITYDKCRFMKVIVRSVPEHFFHACTPEQWAKFREVVFKYGF